MAYLADRRNIQKPKKYYCQTNLAIITCYFTKQPHYQFN